MILNHYLNPYIHSKVYLFFNGFYLLLSLIFYIYILLFFRISSVSGLSYLSLIFRSFSSTLVMALSIVFLAFLTNTSEIIQRDKLFIFLLTLSIFQIALVISSKIFYGLIKPKDLKNIMIVSDADSLKKQEIQKFINDSSQISHHLSTNDIDKLIDLAIEKNIESVYVYLDSNDLHKLEDFIQKLSVYAFELNWILPDTLFPNFALNSKKQILKLNPSPITLDSNQYMLKRSLDVLGSLTVLLFSFPILIVCSLIIKLYDKGPVFYRQTRNGLHGKSFDIYKFRSMASNSDFNNKPVLNNDPRVTPIGKFLRKTGIDELPQLINVLKGEMSLVGPRPHIPYETDLYSKNIIRYLVRHQVKPGLTGLAQIRVVGKTNIDLMRAKLKNDLEYIYTWSFFLDLKILTLTPISLWRNRDVNL
ncbi:exopolysaccharide biosynthesis polyprenyl glycosylphosphotransferase [Gammaproteobacteria bacterium]|nr:exopolysaccharide biosynthesis polyprenyl glycosylphosphotransferase [Gammaproteobacteria bacterium]